MRDMLARMMRLRRIYPAALIFLLALALEGCFVSEQPLLTPANADYPFGPMAAFLEFDDLNATEPSGESELVLREGYYGDPSDAKERYLFKSIGGGFYVIQTSEAPPSQSDPKEFRAFYKLMRIDGDLVYSYDSDCSPRHVETFSASGAITRVQPPPPSRERTCFVRDLAALIEIFDSLKTSPPEGKARLR